MAKRPLIRGSDGLRLEDGESSVYAGFTLLELMISLTIVGLILVLVFGALRIGARAWEKGEKDIEIHQRQRVVFNNVARQIASISPDGLKGDDNKNKEKWKGFFRGGPEEMAFVTRLPMSPMIDSGMVYARYAVREDESGDGKGLFLFEKEAFSIKKEEDLGELGEDEFSELISGAEAIEFAYLKGSEAKEGTSEWVDVWSPDSNAGLPLAVRITFQQDAGAVPIQVIARIQTEVKETQP